MPFSDESCTYRLNRYREDVRGVAGVALATPFFQDFFICHMVFWPSGHPDFWPFGLLAIRSSGHPAI